MNRADWPRRRALTTREFMVTIVLAVCCTIVLGIGAYAVQLPLWGRGVIVLAVVAITLILIIRGRRGGNNT